MRDDSLFTTSALAQAVIERRQPVLRLDNDHFLVQWQPGAQVWCVVNMAALDEHSEHCAAFRCRKYCQHLDLICRLCSEEREPATRIAE